MPWADLKAMVIHLPPTSRFKSTFDPGDQMKPDEARPVQTSSEVRARIAAQFAK